MTNVVVLDSLFASLDVEEQAAREAGATLIRWDGDPASLAEADVVAHVRTRVDAELVSAMPRCRVISRFGSGIDTVELNAAREAGIAVVTVRHYCTRELATHTLALAFSLVRRLAETGFCHDSSWDEVAAATPIRGYHRATVVGLGAIGRAVAGALIALGYEVRAVTRRARSVALDLGARPVDLEEGFALGDIVLLHTALDDTTAGLVDARRLELMPPGAILVNTARLRLLDEAAVAGALQNGRLGGLALDAIVEPSSPVRRFDGDPRVLITPHVGWYSEESAARLRRAAIADALTTFATASEGAVRS
jgi:D-3-phosphoglycerate dehydrogenase / 2-oxoglutarate reductase